MSGKAGGGIGGDPGSGPGSDLGAMSFEEAMAELEKVVGQLERGDVALDDSIALYERGAALKAHCEARLKAAEEKVAVITLGPGGQPSATKPAESL